MVLNDNKILRKRYVRAFLSSVASIALVLFLVGIAATLLVSQKSITGYLKENMQVSVMMKPQVGESAALKCKKTIDGMAFTKSSSYISKEQGAKEMASLLGEDFLDVFETSPIPISVNLTLKADYVTADSLEVVKSRLGALKEVSEVVCQQSLVEALNSNLNKISIFLAALISLLLFISFVLINNTVRLSVHSRRFTIHTMKMVGATKAFIRRPFVLESIFQGLFASFLAVIFILCSLVFLKGQFSQLFSVFTIGMLLTVILIVVGAGLLICTLSTVVTVNKLVGLDKAELYI
ncbi:MAG: permease-like cell division protein FtsX [Bacteroidales bacterium]|nr:permease-like cell division protein FtsX [Rikenellaceae bacterium]MDD6976044.1 permease-like cell division protein FtsX [Bacteroidales bacterium]MDY4480830.1 permease-like cell division protein FtsX [Candidatus Cryptobacteroides sp.]MDY4562370.1 permease-like cell division protein FtsX [Candidatus Cryptobacteroides sp.]MDY6170931.1 permease-like cell division protein FtsX [Candidatus Cryptobacteroides sp.]